MTANSLSAPLRGRVFLLLALLLVLPACGMLFGTAAPTEAPPAPGQDPTAAVDGGNQGEEMPSDSPTVTPAAGADDGSLAPEVSPGDILFDESRALNALEASSLEGVLNLAQYQSIRIDAGLIEGAMDYNVVLLNSAGTVLATLEGRAGRNSVGINEFTAPVAGQYRVRVSPLDGGGIVQMRVIASGGSTGGGGTGCLWRGRARYAFTAECLSYDYVPARSGSAGGYRNGDS